MTASAPATHQTPRVVAPVLEALELKAGYQRRQVLYDVSLNVGTGEIVAVLGHNGAGKTTLLKAIIGFIPLFGGQIWLNGKDRTARTTRRRFVPGCPIPRPKLPSFAISRDNLELGGFTVADAQESPPHAGLRPLPDPGRAAGSAWWNAQRRPAADALARHGDHGQAKLMLLDEPSLGLSPAIVQSIFQQIKQFAADDGMSVVLVEQNVRAALRIADRAYFMRSGEIILEQDSATALARGSWWDLF